MSKMKNKKYDQPPTVYELILEKHGKTLSILYPHFMVHALRLDKEEDKKTLEKLIITDKVEDVLGPSTEKSFAAIQYQEELNSRKHCTSYPQSNGIGLRTSKYPKFHKGPSSYKY